MQKILYRVKLRDGREFRIFCANSTQTARFYQSLTETLKKDILDVEVIQNGIHDVKQWEQIVSNLHKE